MCFNKVNIFSIFRNGANDPFSLFVTYYCLQNDTEIRLGYYAWQLKHNIQYLAYILAKIIPKAKKKFVELTVKGLFNNYLIQSTKFYPFHPEYNNKKRRQNILRSCNTPLNYNLWIESYRLKRTKKTVVLSHSAFSRLSFSLRLI